MYKCYIKHVYNVEPAYVTHLHLQENAQLSGKACLTASQATEIA